MKPAAAPLTAALLLLLQLPGPAGAQLDFGAEADLLAVLRSGAPAAEKAVACQRLAVVGGRESVPVLASLLGDETLGGYARLALEPMPEPEAGKALRAALGQLEGRPLIGVINSLGARRDARATPALIGLFRDGDQATAVKEAALGALGRTADPGAVAALEATLSDPPPALVAAAADACLAAAAQLSDPEEAIRLYGAVRRSRAPAALRQIALSHLIVARGDEGADLLMEKLQSTDAEERDAAIGSVRRLTSPETIRRLTEELPYAEPPLAVHLIPALADHPSPALLSTLEEMVKSGPPDVRRTAIGALGKVGGKSSVPILVEAHYRTPDAATLQSLREIEAEGVDLTIAELIPKMPKALRIGLIGVLTERGSPEMTGYLLGETNHRDDDVVVAALEGLSSLAGPRELSSLLRVLTTTERDRVREAAEATVARVCSEITDPERRSAAILQALETNDRPATRAALIRVLGSNGGKGALEAVTSATGDPDPGVVDAAVRALSSWPDVGAGEALRKLAAGTGDPTHRVLAHRGWVRLLGQAADRPPADHAADYAEAMRLAPSDAERMAVLGGLARVTHPDALALALAHLGDDALREEAASAAANIGQGLLKTHPEAARAALKKVLEAAADRRLKRRVREMLQPAPE